MSPNPPQKILKTRRDYNTWVANEMMEDYALRYAPKSFRKWSEFRVANTALGAVSFLALEAIGGTLVINYGFTNAVWAILVVSAIIFVTGIPIGYYASRYNLDMDLLTRGAGFGYIGSTITSLIYASFTFIFFALEAAIMALALEMYFEIPLWLGYVVSSLAIVPLVTHGITWISRLQLWTQPLWLFLMILPFASILVEKPELLRDWTTFGGKAEQGVAFSALAFGAACTVAFSLIAQIGEQVDFLRFLPDQTRGNRRRWRLASLAAGAGWIVPGAAKQFGGAFLAFVAIQHEIPLDKADEPTQMYLAGFNYVFSDPALAALATTAFVVLSQAKINVTNAYAGSLAWSNFFSRLTHSHPGRVVWLGFNVMIAFLLMELGVFGALEKVLGLYSNVAIAWVGALVADLVVNKPLGLSPPFIEFKRAHLYDVNPVGVGAMGIASAVSISAYVGLFGETLQAFAPFVALVTAFLLAPAIAWATGGRYYLARERVPPECLEGQGCCICGRDFETEDKTFCPIYEGVICSLCCSLDARCGDACKPSARLRDQIGSVCDALLPTFMAGAWKTRLGLYLTVFAVLSLVTAAAVSLVYYQQTMQLTAVDFEVQRQLADGYLKVYASLLVLMGIGAWWLVLTAESRRVAQDESNKQTHLLLKEIEDHRRTDAKLQEAKEEADRANLAKSRFLSGMSHELRGPLNSVLGFSEILMADAALGQRHREVVDIIRQSGEHLSSLIDDILDIAKIEARKLQSRRHAFDLPELLEQAANNVRLQSRGKPVDFVCRFEGSMPRTVKGDEKRVRQILTNLLGNAVKYTPAGTVELRVRYASGIAHFEVRDTGIGIAPENLDRIFQPFESVAPPELGSGAGLGLTISKIFTEIMGGELTVASEPGRGTTFRVRLYLPALCGAAVRPVSEWVTGYEGPRRSVLLADDDPTQRAMLGSYLEVLGFRVLQAESGEGCLAAVAEAPPDLVLLDLVMPGIGGLETVRRLRGELDYREPVIIVSANAFDRDRTEALAAGSDAYLVKPVRFFDLKEQLRKHLDLRWTYGQPPGGAEASRAPETPEETIVLPNAETLEGLLHFARIGYLSGIVRMLEELRREDARHGAFADEGLKLAKEFRLRELQELFSRG
jgi:signal transduction histidine kinase/CheY-like chemotaxis protein/purine-cytosine permease-like protein